MKIRKSSAMFAAIAVISATTASWSQEPGRRPQVPVVIEADPNFDACGGTVWWKGSILQATGFSPSEAGPRPSMRKLTAFITAKKCISVQ
ncbi:hypothetical protein GOD68_31585 [Sinorhizobium medicae]|nr:hypothetical protein [Sinorhizobium medicae]MDX0673541.1 hypothetical protein [Sinorhizobium medicae]MDX0710718.1 hypothetical protein [Sinorhizobium medicae]